MSKTVTLWVMASVITVVTAAYQRLTGPTYPVSGTTWFEGALVTYRFDRSHGGTSGAPVNISIDEPDIRGTVLWKRFRSSDDWQMMVMSREQDELTATLPSLPPAGKILYQIRLERNDAVMLLPPEPVVIRYKGEVPLWILIPHVMVMFGAMLVSTRTGLEYFRDRPSYTVLIRWTLGLLFAGGLILGPLVQFYAFDAWWTGWPYGTDLTDNKTAIAFLIWVGAAVALRRSQKPGGWIVAASVVMLIVYLIPHSLFGSELDFTASADPGGQ
ncbi:MAG: hypothetical protein WEB37_00110 [Bacteroidota bacterium]